MFKVRFMLFSCFLATLNPHTLSADAPEKIPNEGESFYCILLGAARDLPVKEVSNISEFLKLKVHSNVTIFEVVGNEGGGSGVMASCKGKIAFRETSREVITRLGEPGSQINIGPLADNGLYLRVHFLGRVWRPASKGPAIIRIGKREIETFNVTVKDEKK